MKNWNRSKRAVSAVCLLLLTLLLFCTGCRRVLAPGDGNAKPTPSPTGSNAEPTASPTGKNSPQPTAVPAGGEEIIEAGEPVDASGLDTYHVVLVVDASESTADPNRNWWEAPCLFLDSLYACADEQNRARMPGNKRIYADVMTYGDTVSRASDQLQSLTSASTVESLKKFLRETESPAGSGDSALGAALENAVDILPGQTDTPAESRRGLVILFTDGYTRASASSSASTLSVQQADQDKAQLPFFGGSHQNQLENALKRAKQSQYEIFVLMFNPAEDRGLQWKDFQQIANYTQRASSDQPGDAAGSPSSQPQGLPQPTVRNGGLFGGGIFADSAQPGKLFNYYSAKNTLQIQAFFAQMAAAMLQGSSVSPLTPEQESLNNPSTGGMEEFKRCGVQIPKRSGVSAAIFYVLSMDGVSALKLRGPDPSDPARPRDYTQELHPRGEAEWISEGGRQLRVNWYGYREDEAGNGTSAFAAVTVLNPAGGVWQILARGEDGKNQSLSAYTTLVSGAKVQVLFHQGTDLYDKDPPVTGGDIIVRFEDQDGPLDADFYQNLRVKSCIIQPPDGAEPVRFDLHPASAEGNAVLTGQYDAPIPAAYPVKLELAAGQMDYSRSAEIVFEPRTAKELSISKAGKKDSLSPPYLAGSWGELEREGKLKLELKKDSWKVSPQDLAEVKQDSKDNQKLIVHAMRQGEGTLTFDVVTRDGEIWTLSCPITVGK